MYLVPSFMYLKKTNLQNLQNIIRVYLELCGCATHFYFPVKSTILQQGWKFVWTKMFSKNCKIGVRNM